MKKIVPGGYYSYDAAGKKIWLDYSYYGVGLENIDRIRNLSKNLDLYSSSGAGKPITVENGCITHSYQGTEADTDKIQVTLKTPITNSLTELTPVDGVVTLETDGKVLVLPTSNAAILPSFNQSVLDPNRLTIAESPFGGLKGSGSPDYAPGTLFCQTDGVYLTDVNGQNSTKTLTAGKLKELSLLTVDTDAHTITEEFTLRNDSESNNPTVIDACDSTDGWTISLGTGSLSVENGRLKINATADSSGRVQLYKSFGAVLSGAKFVTANYECNSAGRIRFVLSAGAAWSKFWEGEGRFLISANTNSKYVYPIRSPAGTVGMMPSSEAGTFSDLSSIIIYTGIYGLSAGQSIVAYIDSITADTGKSAYIELQTPNNLAPSSLTTQCWTGTSYETVRTDSLDGIYSNVSIDTTKAKLLDGTLLDHVYGAGLGRAVFPKGISGAEVTGSTGTMTYSANQGTSQRIGLMFSLPPSDGGRTNFNKIRLKTILTYAPDAEDNYSASYDFADSTNTSYGLQNLSKPWIALYDPASSLIDFYLFTHRPKNLSFKRDETGTIYSLSLYPGAGSIYHGQIPFADLTLDTNSDTIPDCLEAAVNGSVTKFLENYTMVNPEDPDIAQLLSNDNYELMSNDDQYLYSEV